MKNLFKERRKKKETTDCEMKGDLIGDKTTFYLGIICNGDVIYHIG